MPLITYRKSLLRYYVVHDDDGCTSGSRAVWSEILNAWFKNWPQNATQHNNC